MKFSFKKRLIELVLWFIFINILFIFSLIAIPNNLFFILLLLIFLIVIDKFMSLSSDIFKEFIKKNSSVYFEVIEDYMKKR